MILVLEMSLESVMVISGYLFLTCGEAGQQLQEQQISISLVYSIRSSPVLPPRFKPRRFSSKHDGHNSLTWTWQFICFDLFVATTGLRLATQLGKASSV